MWFNFNARKGGKIDHIIDVTSKIARIVDSL